LKPFCIAIFLFCAFGAAGAAPDPADALKRAAAQLESAQVSRNYADFKKAEMAFKDIVQMQPGNATAMVLLGNCYLAEFRLGEASRLAEQVLKSHPNDLEAIGLRGDAMLQAGLLTDARADYETLCDKQPDLLAHARLASLAFAEGDAEKSLASYESAIKAGEENKSPPALRAWCLVQLGELRFRTGNWHEAEQCYQDAMKLVPDDPDVLDHLAETSAARGEFNKALDISKRAIARSPRPEFQQNRGDVYTAMGNSAEAQACYEEALEGYLKAAEAGDVRYYHRLAWMFCDVQALRDPREAVRWARGALQVRRTVTTFDALAWALHFDGKPKDAVAAMDKALRAATLDTDVLRHAGVIYSGTDDVKRSRVYLRRAATINPKFSEFHFRR
jgi:tetratricopeptide (TPR) repeat protein